MARPLRIAYPGAWYYVRHSGIRQQNIFKSEAYGNNFLRILAETSVKHTVKIHCYCLLPNQYHLVLQTINANLSEAMRHLNSVYTQWVNRYENASGPIFQGRFKSTVFDQKDYLLPLSRYVHGLANLHDGVSDLSSYRWSSFRAYLGKIQVPNWLTTADILGEFDSIERYKLYVMDKNACEMTYLYQKRANWPVLGHSAFLEKIKIYNKPDQEKSDLISPTCRIDFDSVVKYVATEFSVDESSIVRSKRGRGLVNLPRAVAMWICCQYSGYRLKEVAGIFNLTHYASVASASARVRKLIQTDSTFARKIQQLVIKLQSHDNSNHSFIMANDLTSNKQDIQ